jgi:hypothetical protein
MSWFLLRRSAPGAGAVEGTQGVQAVADALEQVMEFRLADGLAFRLQVSGGEKDSR